MSAAPGLRILFVNRMASMVRGGGETFDLEISRHLEQLGCRTAFLTGLPLFSGARAPLTRERSFTIRTPYFGWFPWDRVRGGWRLRLADFRFFETKAAAWARERQSEFDVVHVCELPTFVHEWKRSGARVPVVMRLTAPDYFDPHDAVHRADALIASGATLARVRNGIRPDCVDVPNGVDTDLFKPQPSAFRGRHGIRDDEFVVLFVGRFQAVKNHRMLVDAFSRVAAALPAVRLVLAGSGPLEGEVKAQTARLGLGAKVLFLGETAYEDLPSVYAAADLKVIPSLYESFCFAALEAMATALPLVVTDTDWVPTLIQKDQGGKVVPRDDAAAMAAAVSELARDPQARRAMGQWNRRRAVDSYRWEASARTLCSLYGSLQKTSCDAGQDDG